MSTPDSGAPPGAPAQRQPAPISVQIVQPNPPWWVPSTRVLVVCAIFGLAWRVLELIAHNADLVKNPLFVGIASGLFGGSGVAAVIGYYLIASKKDVRSSDQGGAQ